MVHNLSSRIFEIISKEKPFLLRYCRQIHRKNVYKVLFFGSDSIALNSLRKINGFRMTEHLISRIDLVTANNSKQKSAIEKYAESANIRRVSWPLHNLQSLEYDLGLIVAFGHLIRDDVLNKFPLGMVNMHPSLLPRWRGAAPIIHTLLHGDTHTGVTLMKIKPDVFDIGEIICQQSIPVPKDMLLPELTQRLSDMGADMLVQCLRGLPTSLRDTTPQPHVGVTYAKKVDKSISEVRWSEMSSTQVYNLYRGTYGLYTLTTKFRDKQMRLFGAFLVDNDSTEFGKPPGSLEYCETTKAIKVLCKDRKYIYFRSLRIVGKREISAIDFYNGYVKNMPVDKRQCIVS